MIQRIQSIFLLLASACAFLLFVMPFAATTEPIANTYFADDSLYSIEDDVPLTIFFVVAGALALISIFLFSNRKTQLILTRVAIVANVIGLIYAFIIFYNYSDELVNVEPDDQFGIFLPFLYLVFAFLAIRFINKDEKTVRSMDRLR